MSDDKFYIDIYGILNGCLRNETSDIVYLSLSSCIENILDFDCPSERFEGALVGEIYQEAVAHT